MGKYYFTTPGAKQIFQSTGNGASSVFLTNDQLGIAAHEVDGLDVFDDGTVSFSLLGLPDIFSSR